MDVQSLQEKFAAIVPDLEADSRQLALALYGELAKGEPVTVEVLAGVAGLELPRVKEILAGFTGVYFEDGKIVGFWGLTAKPVSNHRLEIDGRTLHGWCAWDTLFLPEILGTPARVESIDPETGEPVRLTVTSEGVTDLIPESAVLSILEPKEEMREDVVSRFCHYIHFFSSRDAGERWTAKNPGTALLSIGEAFELGRLVNRDRFGASLQAPRS